MTPTIAFATLVAAFAGLLNAVDPERWVPFYRGELAQRGKRVDTVFAQFTGYIGQAIGTTLVALLVTIFVFGVIGVAESAMQVWAGAFVIVISPIYLVPAWRHRWTQLDWEPLEKLIGIVSSNGNAKGQKKDPYGPFDQTRGAVMRHTLASPGFTVAPMYIAAAASGLPNVWNAIPVAIAYVVFTAVGTWWVSQQVAGAGLSHGYRRLAEMRHLLLAAAILALGLVTITLGMMKV